MTTRGIRNNNPLNIIKSNLKWEGKITPSTDSRFEQFKDAEDGIRAGAKLLLTYQKTHGLDTIEKMIRRFAPPVENPTDKYWEKVAKDVGVAPNETYEVDNYENMKKLLEAMIRFENSNEMPYSDTTFRNALKRAGVDGTPNLVVSKQPIVKASTVAAGAGSMALVGQVVSAVAPLNELLLSLLNVAPWVAGAIILAVIAYIAYIHIKDIKTGKL